MTFWRYVILCYVVFGMLAAISLTSAQTSPCAETTGRIERAFYRAEVIQTTMAYSVYLPPCYDRDNTIYPVLYLMHGSNEDDGQWLRLGVAQTLDAAITAGTLPPMVVALPFGNWIANENRFGHDSWGAVFIDQFMPLIEDTYRVATTRDQRAIGGISRGGFWAFHIALRFPQMFSAVGGHSAYFDRYHAASEYNPLDLALNAPGVESLRLWLDRGRDDFAAPGLDLMQNRLDERGLSYTYTVYPEGQHNNAYWSQHVGEYLAFYAADWTPPPPTQPVIFATSTPRPSPTPVSAPGGWEVFLPVAAFPSLQGDISGARLAAVLRGEYDSALVLGESTAAALARLGVTLNSGARLVADDALFNTIWRDRRLYTLLPIDRLLPRYRILTVDGAHPLDGDPREYLLAFASETPTYDPARLTRLLLSGVTALTRQTTTALDANGIAWAAEAIAPVVARSDFFHISNEVSMYPTCPQAAGPLLGGSSSFCSRPEHFDLLELLGVDIVELSGNHNNDYGYEAYLDTLAWYEARRIAVVGGGRTVDEARTPLLFDHHGNSIALVACNWIGPYYALANDDPGALGGVRPGAASCESGWLSELLPELARAHDVVVVMVQYQEFDEYSPTDRQRFDFRRLADWGADVIIGTSSHFPQPVEFYPRGASEAFIHYGLGNLFFDQTFFAGVRFFMDRLLIYDGRLVAVDLYTGIIEGQGRPRLMDSTERENFLYLIFNRYGGY